MGQPDAPRGTARAPAPARQSSTAAALQQARTFQASGQLARAEALCRDLLRGDPSHSEAMHLLGVLTLQSGNAQEAADLISRALAMAPANAQGHANLGTALMRLGRWAEALAEYDRALEASPGFAAVHHNRGQALQRLGRHEEAAGSFRALLASMPNAEFGLGNLCHAQSQGCDWSDLEEHRQSLRAAVRAGRRAVRPFAFLSLSDSCSEQLQCARTYAAAVSASAPRPLWRGERYAHERIRVAYVSADFRDHIVAHRMAPLYERHDRRRFHLLGVGLAADDGSRIAARCKAALDEFIDVASLPDAEAARRIKEAEVDIAVDLTGYTQGGRPGIFAHRPAPVQVSYLGFPATMGVPYMDYLVADEFVVPEPSRPLYSERIVCLPDAFQVNDRRRAGDGSRAPSRVELGLPEAATVYCCFNNSHKLHPALFDIWARLLRADRASVLWLLAGAPVVEDRLRREAAKRGLDAGRLVFAPRVAYESHLARLELADLFLDTLPFNAGATAGDALWAGVPVLTCSGESFASRMAGSLTRAAGLPELATGSLEEYERLALALAADPQRLASYKARLLAGRRAAALFDGERFCRHLEAAYRRMWERSARGEDPAALRVEPLETHPPRAKGG